MTGYANGGLIPSNGQPDGIPVWLSTGSCDYLIPASDAKRMDRYREVLEAMNRGDWPASRTHKEST